MSTKNSSGAELSQLARLLFDSAANSWCLGILFQTVAGIVGMVASIFVLDTNYNFILAFIGLVLVAVAAALRVSSDGKHNRAETMRRQAAFTEGLGWPVNQTLLSDWRLRAGVGIVEEVDSNPRSPDYYSSKRRAGSQRLLEMTIESAFYTRHLYAYLERALWVLFLGSLTLSFLALTILPAKFVPHEFALQVAFLILLTLPILFSLDLLGLAVKLKGLQSSILEVERDMENILKEKDPDNLQTIRLVSEYNCQVAAGFPIHKVVFKLTHTRIDKLWNKRK